MIWKDLEKPEVEVELEYREWKYRKWICIICVIEISGSIWFDAGNGEG